jgi:hypothetical protein
MVSRKKNLCVRCEALGRKQLGGSIHYFSGTTGDKVPVCSVCLLEIKEEEFFMNNLEEDESTSEIVD